MMRTELRRLIASYLVGWASRVTPSDDIETLKAFHFLFKAMAETDPPKPKAGRTYGGSGKPAKKPRR